MSVYKVHSHVLFLLIAIFIFVLAGLAEIGSIILILYGISTNLSFGRVYAAYGGVFVILAVLWGWLNAFYISFLFIATPQPDCSRFALRLFIDVVVYIFLYSSRYLRNQGAAAAWRVAPWLLRYRLPLEFNELRQSPPTTLICNTINSAYSKCLL